MPRDGRATRERILDAAHDLVLRQGFGATSIDQVLAEAEITKGAFYYHFKSKVDLARALVGRYVAFESGLIQDLMARASRLSTDPLQQVLILVGLYQEMFEGLSEPHPGCLFASYCYQNDLISDEEIRSLIDGSLRGARQLLGEKLAQAAERHPPRVQVDLADVADMLNTVFEGAFVMARTLNEPDAIVRQLQQYRNYLALLFGAEAG